MHLLHATGIEKAFGDRAVLRDCQLSVETGARIGLVGVNGSGKSTLLNILAGGLEPDHGRIDRKGSWALLHQEPCLPGTTVQEAVEDAIGWHRQLLTDFQRAMDEGDTTAATQLQDRLDHEGWSISHRVEAVMDRLGLPPADAPLEPLSGGERRRVALARALLMSPDLLLLDEPTNHLDAETCEWLQGVLASWRGAVLLVTHDRYLLESVATSIVEVEDGETVFYGGSYTDYLIERAERRAKAQRKQDQRLALIAQEAEWAARSPAARSTKQKARLQRLDALRSVRPIRKEEMFRLDLKTGHKRGGPLVELHKINKSFGTRRILSAANLVLRAGETIGIVGPNGAGKSTLLSIIAGAMEPDSGTVNRAPRQHVAVLDQHRTGLDPHATVFEAAGAGNDHVFVGERPVHVATLLDRFQFSRAMHDQPVAALSGGERARLLLARVMLQGANVLLLDEPTNDLDLLTLQVLEAALLDFDGAAVVVTHDRAFLDRVCDGIIALDGDGSIAPFATRAQHLAARQAAVSRESAPAKAEKSAPPSRRNPDRKRTRRTYKERQEYAELPDRIESAERELERVSAKLADPNTYQDTAAEDLAALTLRAQQLPEEIEELYERWTTLEALSE